MDSVASIMGLRYFINIPSSPAMFSQDDSDDDGDDVEYDNDFDDNDDDDDDDDK